MSKITDYAFLFQKSFGTSGVNAIGSFQLSQLNSSSVQAQLKAAGINTNSKQYKSAVKQMMSAGNGAMYGNIQGIKNLMSHYGGQKVKSFTSPFMASSRSNASS